MYAFGEAFNYPHRGRDAESRRRHGWETRPAAAEAAWQEEELSTAALPDKRLARRLRRLLDQMSAAPGKPIPAACGDWAAAKAAYRFFDTRV
ncbi:transposase [Mesorhizobium sp. M1272]